jgi:membrane protease YdiL (CAAX protease family)
MKKPLLLFFIVFSAWTLVRILVPISNGLEEIFIKPFVFLIPTLIFAWTDQPKKYLQALGFKKTKLFVAVGWGVGAVVLVIICKEIFSHTLGGQTTLPNFSFIFSQQFCFDAVVSFFTAICEEVVFRGYMFNQILLKKNFPLALVISTLAFVVLHLPRAILVLHLSSYELFAYLYLLFIMGTIDALVFWKTKNIVGSTLTHALWNLYSYI